MPEHEPEASPESYPGEEREPKQPSYSVEDLLEAMVVAKDFPGVRGADEAAKARRPELVGDAHELLGRYKIGIEPDFDYLADAIDFVWAEVARPELVGLPSEEAAKRRGELEESRGQREAEFVKQAYERLLVRRKQHGG